MGALLLCYSMSHFPFSASQPMSVTVPNNSTPRDSLPPANSCSSRSSSSYWAAQLHLVVQISLQPCDGFSLAEIIQSPIPSPPLGLSSAPLAFLISSSSLGLQLQTLRGDTAHQPTSRPNHWYVRVCVCVPAVVVTVGPHRV